MMMYKGLRTALVRLLRKHYFAKPLLDIPRRYEPLPTGIETISTNKIINIQLHHIMIILLRKNVYNSYDVNAS